MDTTQIPAAEKFIYDYNLGRAYDLSGSPSIAYPFYVSALAANPNYIPAAEKAFENLRQSGGPEKIVEALRLADLLLKNAQSEFAARETLRCLDLWGELVGAEELLTVLVRHYTVSSIEPEGFLKEAWPALKELMSRHSGLRPGITEMRIAFEAAFEPVVQAPLSGPVQPFPTWWRLEVNVAAGERLFPKLLNRIGNYYYGSAGKNGECRDPVKALARYMAAWSLDPFNTEAALFTAAVLRDYSSRLDPVHRLYNQFVEGIFHEKGGLYAKASKTSVDWANLMRMHYLLGSIFEADQVWGSEDTPRSAIYQWMHAIGAENKLRELDHKYPPTPGLHQCLATAYKLTQQPRKAREQFLCAAEEFADLNDFSSAKEALAGATGRDAAPGPVDQKRVDQIVARLESGSGGLVQVGVQNPKDVLDKAIKALGGEEMLIKATTVSWKTKGTITFNGNENEFTSKATLQGLDHYRSEIDGKFGDADVKVTTVLNGDKVWQKFNDNDQEIDADRIIDQRHRINIETIPTTLVQLKGKGFKIESAADEEVGAEPAAVIKVTGPEGKDFKLYFDKESGLPVKLVAKVAGFGAGEDFTQETTFGDYKDFDGIKKATKISSKRDGEKYMEVEVTEFKVLDKVNSDTFADPK